ncbi:MAG: hypothetical protein NT154_12310 [Verrucomicrobia bacterium]|nr:hypothetical protein [Verrucomicrobiota bacterium]
MRKGKLDVLRIMPRAMRVEYPGAIHVMARGDRLEDLFVNDVDWWRR